MRLPLSNANAEFDGKVGQILVNLVVGRAHIHTHVERMFGAAQQHSMDGTDVAIVAPPGDGNVAVLGTQLLVGSKSTQPAPGHHAEHQACDASAPTKRGRPGGGSVRK